MEFAREHPALQLLRLHDAAQRIPRDSLRKLDGDRGAGRERLGEPQVVVGEACVRTFLVVDLEHADRSVAGDQRHPHPGTRAEPPRHLLMHLGVVDHRVDALAATARKDLAALRARARDRLAEQIRRTLSCDSREPQIVLAARQRERDDPRTDQLT